MSLATRNIEPIPGYTLRERIGAGGYGEVWKADAPGGLAKAIKLVYGYADGDRATRESKALSLIKSLRHPFLLSLERIEIVDGQLAIVTELADCSLKDRFERRRMEGLRGIPRPELLQFMRDAADALDYMNEQHSLQHLDVKPENLLLVGEHVKVADFGLVKDVQKQTASMLGGLTPVYASPELFSGSASRRSDQYSLAIVYQEMLTGVLPFPGKTAAQLAAQHMNAKPLLFSLPPGERKVVARALAKDSSQRFASCREFVDFLCNETLQATLPAPETWFASQNGPPREEVENVSSTMCLNTARMSSPLVEDAVRAATEAVPNYERDTSACAEGETQEHDPYARDDVAMRESEDMFADLDEAVEQVDTAFSTTFVMRKAREPRLAHVDAQASDAPPMLRPTVIVGIGHVASLVMQRFKQRLADRLGQGEACPAVQLLLLDADSQEIQRAARGDDGAPLDPQEVMLLGLRKSQEYRNESPALLQWISRRWLYNIPRSQTPEGLRPLGRLAFVDQARNVRDRLRKSLQKATAVEALQATAQATGVPCSESPRVIVLGAICGGTAGGMMLDVCYLARQLLERQGQADRDVLGLMMHYRGRQPAAHELALVNTYATLAELDYYSRPEKAYPGDPSCGLEPRKDDHAPMRSGYFVHLGDFISDAELAASADRVAEYLYLDCLTALAPTLQACRQTTTEDATHGLALRSFGVSQIGFSSGEMIPWAAMSLCTDLFQRWMGEGQSERSEVEAMAEREAEALLQTQRLELEGLLQTFLTEVGRRLPDKPDAFFHSLLSSSTKALDAAALAQLDFNAVLARLSETLAGRSEDGLGPEAKYPPPMQQLATLVDTMAKKQAQEISQWVARRTATCGLRMCGAERAASVISKYLTAIHDTARAQRKPITEKLDQLEHWLGAGDPSATGGAAPVRRSPQEFEARYLEYGRLRMFNVALFFLQQLARRIKNALVPMHDLLSDARRDLKGLVVQMNPGELVVPETLDLDAQLRRALMNEFLVHRGQLVQDLDRWLEGTLMKEAGGFLPCIIRGGEHRMKLVTELFHTARSSLMQSLKGLNVATFLLESCEGEEGPQEHRLAASLDAARPKLLADGTCRTLIAMSENFNDDERRGQIAAAAQEHNGARPALVGYRDSDVSIVCELAELAVPDLAVRLIDERTDFIDYARRIFSRSDIPFEPLAPKEEEEVSA
jgi:serine/threonine protein kinase